MIELLLRFRGLLTPSQRRSALVLSGFLLVGTVLETLGVGLVVPLLALIVQPERAMQVPGFQFLLSRLGEPTQDQLIRLLTGGLVCLYLVKNLFLGFLAWRQTRFAFGIQAQLSQRLFAIYLRQPYTFHLQRNSAQLIRNVTGEVTIFTESIMSALLVFTELLVLSGIATLLLLVEPVGAIIVVAVLGGAGCIFYLVTRGRIAQWGAARQRHEGMRLQHLQQGLGGAKDVKLLGREQNFLDQYWLHNASSARAGQFQATIQQLPRLWLELLAVTGLATLVMVMVLRGGDMAAMVPTLGLFAAAAFRLMPSINRVLAGIQTLRYAGAVINNLSAEVTLETALPGRANDFPSTTGFHKNIRLVEIGFSYPGAANCALHGINMSIEKGESIGLIGASGSGKSTLVDVVLGLLTPDSGGVVVDGRDIQAGLRAWQDRIGYVPQSIYLSDDTLRSNVAFGLATAQIDDAAVLRAVKSARLDALVASLPDGLNTIVGERGIRLSGGQRQRVGIARALYHDPDVLVLDEATSALDVETEQEIMQAVRALKGVKTVLVVAHRLSTVSQCDRLYKIEQGRMVAEGHPGQLLEAAHSG